MMTPSQFFKLTGADSTLYKDDPFYTDLLARGKSIASPYLCIDFANPLPTVKDHEGHHRMGAILSRYGDMAVPVGIHPVGKLRLGDLTKRHVLNLRGPVVTEKGRPFSPSGIEKIYFNDETLHIRYMKPAQAAPTPIR